MAFSIAPQPIDSQLSSYDYLLPPDRIAQNPVVPRDRSRLLVVNSPHSHEHQWFYQIPHWLKPGDLLVLNNTQVIPARLRGHKLVDAGSLGAGPGLTGSGLGAGPGLGAEVEVLLLEALGDDRWLTLVKPGRRLKPGAQIIFTPPQADGGSAADRGATATVPDRTAPNLTASALTASALTATVLATDIPTGGRVLQFSPPPNTSLWDCFQTLGEVPIPPYITASQATPDQYQTVYSSQPGAVAAPTAGLHFTPELLAQLQAQGIDQAQITLHVGVGTFRPVEVENINHHAMHGEWIEISPETVAKIHETQSRGGRIIAVGTTVVRALEGAAALGTLQPYQGKVNLFIHPGYPWQVVEGLVTNFHLPRSSLMMLVSALVGRQRLLDLYALAIEHHYRFYSFGDAMVILPEARPSFSA